VKKALLSLAVAGLALTAVQASFAQTQTNFAPENTGDLNNYLPINRIPSGGAIPLQQAYRINPTSTSTTGGGFTTTATQADTSNAGSVPGSNITAPFARNVGFCGANFELGAHYVVPGFVNESGACITNQFPNIPGVPNELVTAVPGIFALCSVNRNLLTGSGTPDYRQRLNCNAFAQCNVAIKINGFGTMPAGSFGSPFVQSCRLTKNIPLQPKCPGVYPGASFTQFGSGIRTWWSLIYSPPGTEFILRITTRCLGLPGTRFFGQTSVHIDEYHFKVVVTVESLLAVIDVLHSFALGTSEIPCIAAEDVYLALRLAVARIFCASGQQTQQDRLFTAEALVIAFCAFGDCFDQDVFFGPGVFPPSNDVSLAGAFGPTGIIDTFENPCCCKLLVDLDNLGNSLGILSTF